MENKMTIFYKKRTLEIDVMAKGEQSLATYDMDIEDAKLIYGYFTMEYNEYLLRHRREFELVKNENGNLSLQMKEEYKKQAKQFL